MGGEGKVRKAKNNGTIYKWLVNRVTFARFNGVGMEWMPEFDILPSLSLPWRAHLSLVPRNDGVSVGAKPKSLKR